jgi:ankyrin repeat protein
MFVKITNRALVFFFCILLACKCYATTEVGPREIEELWKTNPTEASRIAREWVSDATHKYYMNGLRVLSRNGDANDKEFLLSILRAQLSNYSNPQYKNILKKLLLYGNETDKKDVQHAFSIIASSMPPNNTYILALELFEKSDEAGKAIARPILYERIKDMEDPSYITILSLLEYGNFDDQELATKTLFDLLLVDPIAENEEGFTFRLIIQCVKNINPRFYQNIITKLIVNPKSINKYKAIDFIYEKNDTFFVFYVMPENAELIKELLDRDDKIEARDKFANNLLHVAACCNNTEIIKALLNTNVNIEATDENGKILFLIAIRKGYTELASVLLSKGANIEATDEEGKTPLMLAIQSCNTELASVLLSKGANIEATDEEGKTPLMLAILSRNTELASVLLSKGANIEAADLYGMTPLKFAAITGNTTIAEELCKLGANLYKTIEYILGDNEIKHVISTDFVCFVFAQLISNDTEADTLQKLADKLSLIDHFDVVARRLYIHTYNSRLIHDEYRKNVLGILEPFIGSYDLETSPSPYFKPKDITTQKMRLDRRKELVASQPKIHEPISTVIHWQRLSSAVTLRPGKAKQKFDLADARDFSGVTFLHDKGFLGENVRILISEIRGVQSSALYPCINCTQLYGGGEHGINVMSVVHAIAPKASLSGINSRDFDFQSKDNDICNMSWGCNKDIEIGSTDEAYYQNIAKTQKTLFIMSGGNDGGQFKNKEKYSKYLIENNLINNEFLKNFLFVTSITPYGVLSAFSNQPGVELQDHTISALGTDVEAITHKDTKEFVNGTSFSAPIVSGVAALLKGEYPQFSPFDLKTCLLESADRTVFANYGIVEGELQPDGKVLLDPTKYGKGILNAKHAYLYAKILNSKRMEAAVMHDDEAFVSADSPIVKQAFADAVQLEEKQAGRVITKKLEASPGLVRARKRLRSIVSARVE